jgi:PAS domain S-box-containing protein
MKNITSSIQGKLMRMVLMVTGVVLLLTCLAFFSYEYLEYKRSTREQLESLARVTAAQATSSLAFSDTTDALEVLTSLKAERYLEAAILFNEKGQLFAAYPAGASVENPPAEPIKKYIFENGSLKGFEPVIQRNGFLGTLYLQTNLQGLYNRLTQYGIIALIILALAGMIAYLLTRRLHNLISKPIRSLALAASTVSNEHDYTIRAHKFDNDEIGVLTDAFNHMLSQIETQNDEITSFSVGLEQKVNERTLELKNAYAELKEKNEFVETIIESSTEVIAVFDDQLRYLMINKYGTEVYKIKKEEIIGRTLLEVFPRVEGSTMHQMLLRALSGEVVHQPYYRSLVSDRILENFFIPLHDENNKVNRVLVMGHDITAFIKANEQLKQVNSELQQSNHDLEQFAYVASHDLQEPLRKIQTFSNMALSNIDKPEQVNRHLQKVTASAGRMTELIRSILNYSRLNSDDVQFSKVDLNKIVHHLRTDLELRIHEKDAEIVAENLPVVNGNEQQLSQLLLNLISNSLKFSTRKPVIRITASAPDKEQLAPLGLNGNSYVRLSIEDNGIGFEQQYAHKIFDVFQRLHSREEYPGTGIGLALCKRIVDNHRGKMIVESVPGEGTTFHIFLPVQG